MKKLSIIPELINSESIKILDENDIPVTICQKSQFRFVNTFTPPSILIDNFEKRRYKDIEIKTIDLDYLNKFSYRLVSVKTTSRIRNYPRQNNSYVLEPHNKPIPNSQIINKIPKDHFVEFDIINYRIRIKGKNVFPYLRAQNATPWLPVVKK